jgi:hypothetical protein
VWSGEDKAMGSQYPGNRKSDEQLEAILFETAVWTVNGRNGWVMCTAPSLRRALDRAADFAASGAVIVAICRTPGDNIIVFETQAKRLRNLCAGREVPILREADYGLTSDEDAMTGEHAR